MLPRPKTIDDEGGIEAHIKAAGIDWELFKKLDDAGLSNSAIGKLFGKGRDTIRRWREKRKGESLDGQSNSSTSTQV